jgi:hypothetical protein
VGLRAAHAIGIAAQVAGTACGPGMSLRCSPGRRQPPGRFCSIRRSSSLEVNRRILLLKIRYCGVRRQQD